MQKLFKEQGAQALAAASAEARPPFETAVAPESGNDISRAAAPTAIESGAERAPSIPAPSLSADELALLREILAELHEAERILVQTRSPRP